MAAQDAHGLRRKLSRSTGRPIQISGNEVGATAGSSDSIHDIRTTLNTSATDHDVSPFGGKRDGDGPTNVPGGACDQRSLAFKPVTHDVPSSY
jgi:hypothetical protein